MNSTPLAVRIAGLHKLPFDEERYEQDGLAGAPPDPAQLAEWRAQVRECWENAWIVVVECCGPQAALDFGQFAHPQPGPNAQAAYLEQILERRDDYVRAAFFLHYVEPSAPLWYGGHEVRLPAPTPAPPPLVERMEYTAPA